MATTALPTGPTIHYTDSGGSGPALVFAHGLLLDGSMFDEQVETFAPNYRCIVWDARGHGATSYDGAPFSYWDSARDGLALMDHLGIERAVLVGMSQGGFASLRGALLAPERVRALVLIDTQAGREIEETAPAYEAMAHSWVTQGPNPDLLPIICGLVLGPNGHGPWIEKWLARPQQELEQPFRTLMDRDDITARLGEITAPALVIHGSDDHSIPMERAEQLAAGLPGSDGVHVIDGGAHASNVTHPAEVNAVLAKFLAGLPV